MRIAIISDIHGNLIALDAVLDDLRGQGVDRCVCLGDAVQSGAQPVDVVTRLLELGWPIVMGNADAWLLSGVETGHEAPASRYLVAVREWSLSQLSEADRSFIGGFEDVVDVALPDGKTLRCAHGSPTSFNDEIIPATTDDALRAILGPIDGMIICGGHTHTQQFRRLGEGIYLNPGSVALPFRWDSGVTPMKVYSWAEYAIVTATDDGRIGIEFRQVPFDVGRIVATIHASGMPEPDVLAGRYLPGSSTTSDSLDCDGSVERRDSFGA